MTASTGFCVDMPRATRLVWTSISQVGSTIHVKRLNHLDWRMQQVKLLRTSFPLIPYGRWIGTEESLAVWVFFSSVSSLGIRSDMVRAVSVSPVVLTFYQLEPSAMWSIRTASGKGGFL